MKICNTCKIEKNQSEFHKDATKKDGLRGICKGCFSIYMKTPRFKKQQAEYYKTPEGRANQRRVQLKRKYGITQEQYEAILALQGGGCAICETKDSGARRFSIDHDHTCCPGKITCGKCIRGLLCHNCNTSLGGFRDEIELLDKAIKYLIKHKENKIIIPGDLIFGVSQ